MEHDHPLAVTIVINSDEPITMHHEIGVPTSELTKAHDKKLLNMVWYGNFLFDILK